MDDSYLMDEDGVRDIYLAALILAYGGTLVDVDKHNPRKQIFYFDLGNVDRIYVMEAGVPVEYSQPSLEDIKRFFTSQVLWCPPGYPASIRSIRFALYN